MKILDEIERTLQAASTQDAMRTLQSPLFQGVLKSLQDEAAREHLQELTAKAIPNALHSDKK